MRQQALLGNESIIEHDLPGDGGAQRQLSLDLRRGEALGPTLDQEAANGTVELGPDQGDIGHGRIGDPHLVAAEAIAARGTLGPGRHRARIGAVVGLGEAKAADDLAGCELRQVFAALRLAAELEDGMHDQRGLHRHGGAIAGIHPLDLPRDQSIGDVAEPGAAVLFRDRRAEEAQRSHFLHDCGIEALLAIVEEDARKQLVLGIAARGVAHHAFFRGELAFEVERIVPVEVGLGAGRLRPLLELLGGLRHGRTPDLLPVWLSCARSLARFKGFTWGGTPPAAP